MRRSTSASTRITLPNGGLWYYPAFYSPAYARRLLARLQREIHWEQHELRVFARRVRAPRLSAWYGDPDASYRYSGLVLSPRAWLPGLRAIKQRVERVSGYGFNGVLCNLYRDGDDAMGWHSDNETELGPDPVVASLSLGAVRAFSLKHKERTELRQRLLLEHGSLLIMEPPTQAYWKHALPRTRAAMGPRLNLTFRRVTPAGDHRPCV